MLVDEILGSAEPVPVVARFLIAAQERTWPPEVAKLDELMYFFGSVYGGGIDHAIATASDGAIPEALRLIGCYGSDALKSWAERLEHFVPPGLLKAWVQSRGDWHSENMEVPSAEFEMLYRESHRLEADLGSALCEYVRENEDLFRKFEQLLIESSCK